MKLGEDSFLKTSFCFWIQTFLYLILTSQEETADFQITKDEHKQTQRPKSIYSHGRKETRLEYSTYGFLLSQDITKQNGRRRVYLLAEVPDKNDIAWVWGNGRERRPTSKEADSNVQLIIQKVLNWAEQQKFQLHNLPDFSDRRFSQVLSSEDVSVQ